jgi:hypothetical protein
MIIKLHNNYYNNYNHCFLNESIMKNNIKTTILETKVIDNIFV